MAVKSMRRAMVAMEINASYLFFFDDRRKSIAIIIAVNIDIFLVFLTSKDFHLVAVGRRTTAATAWIGRGCR